MSDKSDLEVVDCFTPDNDDGSTLTVYKFSDGCEIHIDRGLGGVEIIDDGNSLRYDIEEWDNDPELYPEHGKAMALYSERSFREEIKKEIINNFKMLTKSSISDEKANAYVDSYESTFGNDGLNYLYEESRNLVIETNYGEDVFEDTVPSEVKSDINTLFRKLERINNKDIFDESELIESQKKNIADFAKIRNIQYIKEKVNEEESQQKIADFIKSIKSQDETVINKNFDIRQLETAQKTGYVQGVCESVLAFNTDENRKIMSEATMSFFSKKLLSEMNVTKDMAQKFANPETYKALEKCLFAPAREQQINQTQTQGRRM